MKYLSRKYIMGLVVLVTTTFIFNVLIINQNKQLSLRPLLILFLMYMVLFFAFVIVLYKTSKRNVEPIEKLSEAMDNFSFVYSDKIPRFEYEGQEDIVNLVRSFNQMRNKVLETVSDIKSMSKYKQDFMTNVTHELKTPLTSILGYIETLEAGAIDDQEHNRKFLDTIKRNVQRLSALVDDVLSLAKIENRQEERRKINLTDVFQMVAKDYDLYNKKNISIVLNNKKVIMYADTEEIYSAFSNYITNALKYSPEGEIKIKFFKKENQLFYSVRDSGPGIEQEHIPRIFERFYRLDKGRSRKEGGTGLGLAIVKNVVEKYGGSVGVTSFVGKGSEFYLVLPVE